MANRQRGEVALVVGDETYVLKLTSNAMCEMEAASGRTVGQMMTSLRRGAVTDTRWWFWAMLRAHHPQVTLLDAGDLIDRVGFVLVGAAINDAFTLNTEEATPAGPSNGNPPGARDGIGDGSMLTPAVLA